MRFDLFGLGGLASAGAAIQTTYAASALLMKVIYNCARAARAARAPKPAFSKVLQTVPKWAEKASFVLSVAPTHLPMHVVRL